MCQTLKKLHLLHFKWYAAKRIGLKLFEGAREIHKFVTLLIFRKNILIDDCDSKRKRPFQERHDAHDELSFEGAEGCVIWPFEKQKCNKLWRPKVSALNWKKFMTHAFV